MAELTYDQFSGHGDLTEMATQINAALEKITDRIDKLDDGGSKLLDPTSQGLAINLADGFGRNLEAYLNNPNKRMLGDWILEGSLTIDGDTTLNGDLTMGTGLFRTAASGKRIQIDTDNSDQIKFYSGLATETAHGFAQITATGGSVDRADVTIKPPVISGRAAPSININTVGPGFISSGNLAYPNIIFEDVAEFKVTDNAGGFLQADGRAVFGTVYAQSLTTGSGGGANTVNTGVLTASTKVQAGSGSAGAPSHSFSTDPDLGWYRKTTNTAALSCGGTEELVVSTEQFWAHSVYSRTTGTAANVNVNSLGELRRNTSSRRYKEDIRPLTDSEADLALQLEPVRYRSATGDGASLHTFDGLISEDVAKVNPRWADYSATPDCDCACDDDAEMWEHDETCLVPEGVQYQAIIPALLSLVKRQDARITELESKIQ